MHFHFLNNYDGSPFLFKINISYIAEITTKRIVHMIKNRIGKQIANIIPSKQFNIIEVTVPAPETRENTKSSLFKVALTQPT